MGNEKERKKSVTVFLTDDEYFAAAERATRHRMRIQEYAKSLLTGGRALEGSWTRADRIGNKGEG